MRNARLCAPPLSSAEAFSLKPTANESIGLVFLIQNILENRPKELKFEKKRNGTIKLLAGSMLPPEERIESVSEAAYRILLDETGFDFKLKEKDIFFAGKFTSSEQSEPGDEEKFHYKIFILVNEYQKVSEPTKKIDDFWGLLEDFEDVLPDAQKFCLESYKNRIKFIEKAIDLDFN
jgi:ADP-ribose pyrophosphatase YjhB (NUDIX family)